MNPKVSIVKCDSYNQDKLFAAIRRSFELLGGVERFVKPGDKVLLKPNLLAAMAPETAIDTHPEFLRAAIRVLKPGGAHLCVGDSPSVWGTPQDVDVVYETSGIKKVCQEEGIELVKFSKSVLKSGYPMTTFVDEYKIVNLPKFKTHGLTTLTAGVKNLFGLIPGLYKTELHKKAMSPDEFAKVLIDIYMLARPAISLVDGVEALEADGPACGGKVRRLGLIAASDDAIALDSVLAVIMGLKPQDIPTNREGFKRGLGEMRLENIEVVGERLDSLGVAKFILPQVSALSKIPKPLLNLAKKLLRFRIDIDGVTCNRCQLCVKGCPAEVLKLIDGNITVNHKKCVLCLCCKEICPEGAVAIKKSVLAKLIGR